MQNQWKIGCSFLEDWTPRAPTFTCARLLAIQDSFDRTTRNDCNALWWLDASIIPRGKHTTSRVYREHAGPTMLERKRKKNKPIRREKERGRKKEDSSLLFTGMKWKTWWTRDFEVLYEDWMEGNWYRENESCFLSEIGQSGYCVLFRCYY